MSVSIAIIAALEREVLPLVRGWNAMDNAFSAAYRSFEKEDALVVCAGIGSRAALKCAESVLSRCKPSLVVSAGLAGALTPELRVGQIVTPGFVVNSSTGKRFPTGQGSGTLVSASGIAGPEAKRLLARQYMAQAVDMEAASIAQAAEKRGIPFMAIKAISDEHEFPVPEMDRFVNPYGRFLTAKFIAHLAVRPKLWSVVRKLNANSALASQELCLKLRNLIKSVSRLQSGSESPRPAAS